jgi:hypothetical protein
MSTCQSRPGRRDSLRNENGEVSLSGPTSLESLGPFKYTFKKKKKASKWMPLNLAAAESGSEGDIDVDAEADAEVGSISDGENASSRAVSPSIRPPTSTFVPLPLPLQHPQPQSVNQHLGFDDTSSLTTPRKVAGRFVDNELEVDDTDPTPTQERFDLAVRDLLETDNSDLLDSYHSDLSDTQSTKDRTEAAMSQITLALGVKASVDAFDSLDWDPDLPHSAPDQSPEPVVATPKLVTYTTVGSLVDPDAVQQFTAPNRIQREGAGRRLLMSGMQSRSHYDYFQPRGPAPPLSMQHSMQYTQQLASSPVNFNNYSFNSGATSYSDRPSQATQAIQPFHLDENESALSNLRGNSLMGRPLHLNEQESQGLSSRRSIGPSPSNDCGMQVLTRVGGASTTPQMISGNARPSPALSNGLVPGQFSINTESSRLTSKPAQTSTNNEASLPTLRPSQLREEEMGRPTNINAPVQGLEKMQTLQRLAKFENPMQNLARSRLSEFSAIKVQNNQPPPTNPATALEMLLKARSTSGTSIVENLLTTRGELNRGYQFPPPGFSNATANAQTNPLYQPYGPSAQSSTDHASQRPQGYPQPLTAGPPGQRQYQGGVPKAALSQVEQLWSSDGRTTAVNSTTSTSAQSTSPFDDSDGMTDPVLSLQHVPQYCLGGSGQAEFPPHLRSHDTLPMDCTARYYPQGFPNDMNGQYRTPNHFDQRVMGLVPGDPIPRTELERRAKLKADMGHWFYNGQQQWGMTCTDHIIDREEAQQRRAQNPFGAIGPLSKLKKMDLTCTPEEFDKKSPTELAAPLLGATFGSLLSYADSNPGSRKHLSNLTASSPFLIDSSDTGNQSFFGEDWGAPKKDSSWERYRTSFRDSH